MPVVIARAVVRDDALISTLSRQIPSRITPRLQRVSDRAARYSNDFVEANFQRRAPSRKNPDIDPAPLHGSFFGDVSQIGTGRDLSFRAVLRSTADPRKIAFAEKGERAHEITVPPGRFLVFPKFADAVGNANGTGQWSRRIIVRRKRRPGKDFSERLMNRAIRDVLRRAG